MRTGGIIKDKTLYILKLFASLILETMDFIQEFSETELK